MKAKQWCINIATAQAVSHPEFSEAMFYRSTIYQNLSATTQIISDNCCAAPLLSDRVRTKLGNFYRSIFANIF
ncbi:MAG: hypothetical protein MUE44_11465 [Oscillatoriaceae cyanobacterium Prado104]|jgi:hypothetical protein|nr:hypothetical protein [Oscillatoriaceae cyanobacterium Prado104]